MLWLRYFIFTFPVVVLAFFVAAFWMVKSGTSPSENVITIGSIGEPENLNPIRATTTAASEVTGLVFNGLIRADEELNLIGSLAEGWDLEQSSRLFFDSEQDAEAVLTAAKAAGERIKLSSAGRDGKTLILQLAGTAGTSYQDALAETLAAHPPRDFWLISVRPVAREFPDNEPINPKSLEERVRAGLKRSGVDATIVTTYAVLGTTLEVAGHGPKDAVKKAIEDIFQPPEGEKPYVSVGFEWFRAQDKPIYVFHLRKGVKWHEGTLDGKHYPPVEFTAHDCKFTYDRLVDPKVASRRSPDYVLVESVEVPDDYTFKVIYKKPYSSALISWAMDVLPRHILEGKQVKWWAEHFDRAPLGTGPFKFQRWQSGEKMRLVRNDDYWEGRPNVDAVYIRYIPDALNIKLALESGEIDWFSIKPHEVERFRNKKRFRLIEFIGRGYDYIGWNLQKPLFQDRRVRRALAHAVNVEKIIEHMLYGMAIQSTGTYTPQFWYANPNIKPIPYDLERAKELLAEAGWKDVDDDGVLEKDGREFRFSLITNQGNDRRKDISVLAQADLEKVGVKVDLAQYEWTVFIEKHVDNRSFDAVVLGWSMGIDYDLYQLWHSSQAGDGLNHCGFINEEADRLIGKIRTTYEREKLKKLTWRLQELIYEEQPYLWLTVPKVVVAIHRNRFRVYRPLGDGRRKEEPIRKVKAGFSLYLPYWYRTDHPPAPLRK